MATTVSRQTSPRSSVMASPSRTSTTIPHKRSKTQSEEEALKPSFSDLPSSLLEVIMSRLVLKDNIIASASCKSWCEAALSVRVVEKHPWLLSFSKRSSSFELLDPVQSKLYTLNLPELAKSTVRYSTHSWLLMHTSTSKDMFFFNPFTQ
nr:PREDICTED: F-box protein At4g12382-like [Raphanus sativus]